jgi:alpha-tubulin suppressor-like RCC1 family protein
MSVASITLHSVQTCKQATSRQRHVACSQEGEAGRVAAVAVQCGRRHSCLLMNNGSLYTCGSPAHGRLGSHEVVQDAVQQGLPVEDVPNVMIPTPVFHPQSFLPSQRQYITYVTCGDAHSMAITLTGSLVAWGRNDHGQLGVGDRCALVNMTPTQQVHLKKAFTKQGMEARFQKLQCMNAPVMRLQL